MVRKDERRMVVRRLIAPPAPPLVVCEPIINGLHVFWRWSIWCNLCIARQQGGSELSTRNKGSRPMNGPEIPAQVWELDAASLSDANKTLRILPRELRPYSSGIRMVGRAVTVAASGDLTPVLAGLEHCGAGDVLVVDAGTTEHAVLGELFATEAVRRGMAGIVVYGLCRDTASLAQLPLPIYSLGTIPRAVGAKELPLIQRTIRLGEVEVRPGEILIGDDDGIVVLSDSELDEALAAAAAIQQREAAIKAAILAGTSLFEQLNFTEHVENLHAGRQTSLAFKG
jgi:4-hydroxy-4-methyl-2-oxoglutarate aldolase